MVKYQRPIILTGQMSVLLYLLQMIKYFDLTELRAFFPDISLIKSLVAFLSLKRLGVLPRETFMILRLSRQR